MKPARFDNLSAEDAAVIFELAPILDIAIAKRLERGSERKFYIETSQGEKQNLLVAPIRELEWRKYDDCVYEYVASAGVTAPRMMRIGRCSDGELLYELYTWIDGEDLTVVLPRLSHAEQYKLGVQFGKVARKLHMLPPFGDFEPWEIRCKRRVREAVQSYAKNPIKTRAEDLLIKYLQDNADLPNNRPQTFSHGDWDTSNLILSPDGHVCIIDCGIPNSDPWWEFWPMSDNSHFCAGQVRGYFDSEPLAEYFPLFAFYVAMETMAWGYDAEKVCNIFDDMRNPVPTWYFAQVD